MPQLVKGGKFVFGWCVVGRGGEVPVPPDAREEYGFAAGGPMILFSASRTSGGFILARRDKVAASPLFPVLADLGERAMARKTWRTFVTVPLGEGMVCVPPALLAAFGVSAGTRLLAVRGSHLGLGMILKGRIVAQAGEHRDIPCFMP